MSDGVGQLTIVSVGIVARKWSLEKDADPMMEWVVVECPGCASQFPMPHEGPLARHEDSCAYDMERIMPLANRFAHLLAEQCPGHPSHGVGAAQAPSLETPLTP